MEVVIQLIGALGIISSICSFQCKKHKNILAFKTASEFIFAVQYFFLNAYTGVAMELVGCVRNMIFTKQVEKNRDTKPMIALFSIIFLVSGILTWESWISILGIVAKILSTLAYGNKNTRLIRWVIFGTSTCWLIYNSVVFSIAGILCELFTLISVIIALIRFDLIPKLKNRE